MLRALLVLLACLVASSVQQLGPVYTLQDSADLRNTINNRDSVVNRGLDFSSDPLRYFDQVEYFEWESYDGWFNNPAHPEWGGAGEFSFCNALAKLTKITLFLLLSCRHASGKEDPSGLS